MSLMKYILKASPFLQDQRRFFYRHLLNLASSSSLLLDSVGIFTTLKFDFSYCISHSRKEFPNHVLATEVVEDSEILNADQLRVVLNFFVSLNIVLLPILEALKLALHFRDSDRD